MDYTKLGTMNPAAFDERQHLALLVRDTNYVTALRLGNLEVDLPQHLTKGFAGPPHLQFAPFRVCFLTVSFPFCLTQLAFKCDGFAIVKATSLALVGHQTL